MSQPAANNLITRLARCLARAAACNKATRPIERRRPLSGLIQFRTRSPIERDQKGPVGGAQQGITGPRALNRSALERRPATGRAAGINHCAQVTSARSSRGYPSCAAAGVQPGRAKQSQIESASAVVGISRWPSKLAPICCAVVLARSLARSLAETRTAGLLPESDGQK